jgi:hypothetical protein
MPALLELVYIAIDLFVFFGCYNYISVWFRQKLDESISKTETEENLVLN